MKSAKEMADLAIMSKIRLKEEAEAKRWEKITSHIDEHANRGNIYTSFNQLKEVHVNKLKELGYSVYDIATDYDYYGKPSYFTYVFWDTDEKTLKELSEAGEDVLKRAASKVEYQKPKPSHQPIPEDVKPKKKWWKF